MTDGGCGSAHNFRRKQAIGRSRLRCARPPALGLLCGLFVIVALGGCSLSDGVGPYIADPGRFSAYRCKHLIDRLKTITTREKEVRELGIRLYRAKPTDLDEWTRLAGDILAICNEGAEIPV